MIKQAVTFLALVILTSLQAAEDAPAPAMPTEITLTSGRVLRRVEVVRWEKDRVVLKHAAGADPISFSLIAEPLRSQLPAIRKEGEKRLAEQKAQAIAAANATRTITGQVFVVTRGRDNYLIGDLTIYFVPRDQMDNFTRGISRMDYERQKTSLVRMGGAAGVAAPIISPEDLWLFQQFENAPRGTIRTRTDGEGRFTVKLPVKGEFYAFARDSRMVYRSTEWYVWVKSIEADTSTITLSNSDLWEPAP